jgi:hypothetical protein
MTEQRYYRKVIRITAEDSPNVRFARIQQARGETPTNKIVLPGVLTWEQFKERDAEWDVVLKCIGLGGWFYEGAEVLMYPPQWINEAERLADTLKGKPRKAGAIGCDPGEGKANTAWSVVDDYGLIEKLSLKTVDTTVITSQTIAMIREFGVPAEQVCFDAGGGGTQHAHRLRSQGYNVRTVSFGASLSLEPKRGLQLLEDKKGMAELRYVYSNRRAEMYGALRNWLDPDMIRKVYGQDFSGFALPRKYTDIRHQMAAIPLTRDSEGKLYILPKQKKNADDKRRTLIDIIGYSPDELDSLVVALYALRNKVKRAVAGAI